MLRTALELADQFVVEALPEDATIPNDNSLTR
jgi:hypothetical protein